MIVELFLIPVLFLLFAGWGCWAKLLLSIENKSVAISIVLGLSLYGLIACVIAFFSPLNIPVEIILLCTGAIPYFFKDFRKQLPPFPKNIFTCVWFWVFSLMIILAGSYFPFIFDHFSYYVPTLKWLNEYGIIIGTVNIFWNIGQMSFMHIIQAGIDQTIDPFCRLNIFIALLYLVYIFERKSFLLLLFVPLYFLFFQSLSPDLPIAFFSLIVVNEFCFHSSENNFKTLLTISIFTFIIKPVAFWMPLWIFIVTFHRDKNELKSIRNYIFPGVLLFVFLVKNGIVSSCLFFPVTFTQINTYWLPNTQILQLAKETFTLYTFDLNYDIDTINSFSFFEKVYHWLALRNLRTGISLVIIVITLLFGVVSFLKKRFVYIALFIMAIFKLLIVFSFSGEFRYMFDLIFPILFILFLQLNIKRLPLRSISLVLFVFALLFVSFPKIDQRIFPASSRLNRLTQKMGGFKKEALLTPGNPVSDTYTQRTVGNLHVNVSNTYIFVYKTPPPALTKRILRKYYRLGIFPQWKDPEHIHKGIYMKTLSAEEKEELERIIRMIGNSQ